MSSQNENLTPIELSTLKKFKDMVDVWQGVSRSRPSGFAIEQLTDIMRNIRSLFNKWSYTEPLEVQASRIKYVTLVCNNCLGAIEIFNEDADLSVGSHMLSCKKEHYDFRPSVGSNQFHKSTFTNSAKEIKSTHSQHPKRNVTVKIRKVKNIVEKTKNHQPSSSLSFVTGEQFASKTNNLTGKPKKSKKKNKNPTNAVPSSVTYERTDSKISNQTGSLKTKSKKKPANVDPNIENGKQIGSKSKNKIQAPKSSKKKNPPNANPSVLTGEQIRSNETGKPKNLKKKKPKNVDPNVVTGEHIGSKTNNEIGKQRRFKKKNPTNSVPTAASILKNIPTMKGFMYYCLLCKARVATKRCLMDHVFSKKHNKCLNNDEAKQFDSYNHLFHVIKGVKLPYILSKANPN